MNRQDELQSEVDNTESPYSNAPSVPSADTATLMTQINPAQVLVEIEKQLNGEVYNFDDQKWEQKRTALMNERGIVNMMTIVRGIVNTNCIMSNLSNRQIEDIMKMLSRSVINTLAIKYEDMEVKKADLDTIANLILFMCFFALQRSYNEGERKFLKMSLKSTEHISHISQQQQNSDNILGRIFRK